MCLRGFFSYHAIESAANAISAVVGDHYTQRHLQDSGGTAPGESSFGLEISLISPEDTATIATQEGGGNNMMVIIAIIAIILILFGCCIAGYFCISQRRNKKLQKQCTQVQMTSYSDYPSPYMKEDPYGRSSPPKFHNGLQA